MIPAAAELARLLGVELPIIQAPMSSATGPAMVAAVADAGAMGSLPAGYLAPDQIRDAITEVRHLTSRPFAVNLFAGGRWTGALDAVQTARVRAMLELLRSNDLEPGVELSSFERGYEDPFPEQLAAVLEADVPVLSFTFGIPDTTSFRTLKARGVVLLGTANTVREARALEAAGVDVVVAQGAEAGGHRGTFLGSFDTGMVGLFALVPQVVDAVGVPVVAAGAIMDPRGVGAAFALGASGVQAGTVFIPCNETAAPEAYRMAVLAAREDQTAVSAAVSGRPARLIRNWMVDTIETAATDTPAYPIQHLLTRRPRAVAAAAGDADRLALYAGQGSGLAKRASARELVQELSRGIPQDSASITSRTRHE